MATENYVLKTRTFTIVQFLENPETGEKLYSVEDVEKGLSRKSIKKWAWILHDKDIYTEEDERENGKRAGDPKPAHIHIVGWCQYATPVSSIAKWFNVPEFLVKIPKGHGAFLDCVEYLTHESEKEQAKGKTLYPDDAVNASFEFREELIKRFCNIQKYGRDLDKFERIKVDVLEGRMNLREAREADIVWYADNYKRLEGLRNKFLESQPMPQTRINYYICGVGGAGKGLASRALARSLFPDIERDEDIYFEVGAGKTLFEGYDGQPVIIWNDRRAGDLIRQLGDRGNVFEVFDPHPTSIKQNIKFGTVKLVNSVNIVNGIQPYTEFLDGLAGEYTAKGGEKMKAEDKGQAYRRFPIIIPLHYEDMDIMFSKYFVGESGEPTQFEVWKKVVGNFKRVRMMCQRNEELAQSIEQKMLTGVKEFSDDIMKREQQASEAEILEMFKDYGKTVEEVERERQAEKNAGDLLYIAEHPDEFPVATDPNQTTLDGFSDEEIQPENW